MENLEYTLTYFLVLSSNLIFPIIFKRYVPKSINSWYGYRTSSSMINELTWKGTNNYFSKIFLNFSIYTSIFLLLSFFFIKSYTAGFIILFTVLGLSPLMCVILTEKYLKQTFDKNGNFKGL
jgi:uncharacterized membrane protein